MDILKETSTELHNRAVASAQSVTAAMMGPVMGGLNLTQLTDINMNILGDAHFFEDYQAPMKIRQDLNSSIDADKVKGMKSLLASMSKGIFIYRLIVLNFVLFIL